VYESAVDAAARWWYYHHPVEGFYVSLNLQVSQDGPGAVVGGYYTGLRSEGAFWSAGHSGVAGAENHEFGVGFGKAPGGWSGGVVAGVDGVRVGVSIDGKASIGVGGGGFSIGLVITDPSSRPALIDDPTWW
jgi:hypothetical protein